MSAHAMLHVIWRLVKLALALLILAGGLYLGGPYLLAAAGRYLVTAEPPARADCILVLSGQPYLRVPEAARLYHSALAPGLLLPNAPRPPGMDDLLREGLRFPDDQEISLKILEDLWVPRRAILTLAERAEGIREEAGAVARFLKSRPVRTLIVVTSKSHSTRAAKILRAVLGPKVRVVVHPVPTDPFDPNRWWRSRTDTRTVLHEYEALADDWRLRLWESVVGHFTSAPPPVSVR